MASRPDLRRQPDLRPYAVVGGLAALALAWALSRPGSETQTSVDLSVGDGEGNSNATLAFTPDEPVVGVLATVRPTATPRPTRTVRPTATLSRTPELTPTATSTPAELNTENLGILFSQGLTNQYETDRLSVVLRLSDGITKNYRDRNRNGVLDSNEGLRMVLLPEVMKKFGLMFLADSMWAHSFSDQVIDPRLDVFTPIDYSPDYYSPSDELLRQRAEAVLAFGPVDMTFQGVNGVTVSGPVSGIELNLLSGDEFRRVVAELQRLGIDYAVAPKDDLTAQGQETLVLINNGNAQVYSYNLGDSYGFDPKGSEHGRALELDDPNRSPSLWLEDMNRVLGGIDAGLVAMSPGEVDVMYYSRIYAFSVAMGCDTSPNPCRKVVGSVFP